MRQDKTKLTLRAIEQVRLTLRAIEQVQQLAALFTKRRAQLAAQVGLTEAQWRLLEGITTEHFMPSMFAQEQDNTRGAVSKIIRQLLQKELVVASIASHDGRQRKYELTAKGKKSMDRLRELREEAIREIWSELPEDELKSFIRLNDLLIEKIRGYAERQE
jgi:DNA-binding MarR family transcriptional regulator